MNRVFLWFTFITFVFSTFTVNAQINTKSPYSYYGLGAFELPVSGKTSGMGGVGIGLKSEGYINLQNPASYSGIDSLFFILDFNIYGIKSYFQAKQGSYHIVGGNMNKIAIGFRVSKRFATILGVVPFSEVDYKINSTKWIEGTTETFNIKSEGDGGMNRLYWGVSYKIDKHNSLGVNSSVLFGLIKKTEVYTYPQIDNGYWQRTEKYVPKPILYFDFGYQYSNTLNDKYNYTIGVTGGLKSKLVFSQYLTKETDTTVTAKEELTNTYNFWIPAYFGIGASVSSEKWRFAADYRFQNWSSVKHKNDMNYLSDSYRIAAGVEYCPNKRMGKNLFQRMTYQSGFHYDKSYLTLNSANISGWGLSLGAIIPIRNQLSSVGVSFEYGRTGQYSNTLFKENYYKINLSVNMNDIWFMKRKYK